MKRAVFFATVVLLSIALLLSVSAAPSVVGIDEHLGAFIPLDARFTAEDGARLTLRELVHTPVILSMVYYRCPNACDFLLTGIADVLKSLPAQPGKDFTVITISIDERETPADAQAAKRIGLESIEKPFPQDSWRFLTGDMKSIESVADAIGFRFVKNGEDFDHPLGLVILSPQGKLVRYVNGTEFLPADLKMSLLEASTGTIGPTISKVLRFCFRYDPTSHLLVFNALKVTGIATLLVAAGLVLYLVLSGRQRRLKGKA